MKKFLSIVLALVCVFSTATIAFASANTCPYCDETYKDEAAYNAHLANCDGYFRSCPYKCGADFATEEALEAHKGVCLEYKGECDYCGAVVLTKNAFDAHVAECSEKYLGIPVHKILKALQEFDYEGIFGKVFGFLADFGWNGIFEKVFDVVEDGVHLGVKELA